MNITSSNIASVFPAEQSMENSLQTLVTDGVLTQAFADELNAKIKQLKELDIASNLPEKLSINSSQDITELQGFADLFGKTLPIQLNNKLEENIDLENTLETLEDVLSTLDDVVSEQVSASPADESLIVPGQAVAMNLTAEKPLEANSIKAESEVKAETAALLQQENAFRKPGQDNPVIVAKETKIIEGLELDDAESTTEKILPKFASDIANLNRAVIVEKRADVPPMSKHFAHPEWNKEVAERVIWMHKQAIPSAELRLNPAHLGPITIKIDVTQEQATVAFTAQHAAVKEAIEAALPKLREMFSAQQLNLVDVNVSQDDRSQRQQQGFAGMGNKSNQGEDKDADGMANNTDNKMNIADEIEAGRAIASHGILSLFA